LQDWEEVLEEPSPRIAGGKLNPWPNPGAGRGAELL
jgi:hypothetical protein